MSLEKKLRPWLERDRLENIGAFLIIYWRAKGKGGPAVLAQRDVLDALPVWHRSKVRRFLADAEGLGVLRRTGESDETGSPLYEVYGVKGEAKPSAARPEGKRAPQPRGYSPEFEAAWSAWPPTRRGDKKQAWRYWQERVAAGWDTTEIHNLCDHYVERMRREGTDEKYIRHLATHLSTSGVDNLETERDAVDPDGPALGESFAAYLQRNLK